MWHVKLNLKVLLIIERQIIFLILKEVLVTYLTKANYLVCCIREVLTQKNGWNFTLLVPPSPKKCESFLQLKDFPTIKKILFLLVYFSPNEWQIDVRDINVWSLEHQSSIGEDKFPWLRSQYTMGQPRRVTR